MASHVPDDRVLDLYEDGRSVPEIADELGHDYAAILRSYNRLDVLPRWASSIPDGGERR